ncbi:YceK/YidQ family lipoprotein [Pseudomonas sp. C2L12B]|nr:YceK/YidQ family lipoprotein [Pseudomonas typographi]MBD1589022.1 YceK/YidQ family lipoprotein [Pseudomonas typographi]
MKIKKNVFIFAIFLLNGCGTIRSLQDQNDLRQDMRTRNSHCTTIPYMYGGITYNFCMLNADNDNPKRPDLGLHLTVFDIGLSLAADTALLPYSIYNQIKFGSRTID